MIEKKISSLEKKLESYSIALEKSKISEYIETINNPRKLLISNFIIGIARGIGTAIGFTILAAIIIYIIDQMVNLPLIGKYIAELIEIIENYR